MSLINQIGIIICEILIGVFFWLYCRSRQRTICQEVERLARKIHFLEASGNGLTLPSSRPNEKAAELRARFANAVSMETRVPEKYRHVIRLERSGLGAIEVAEILDVSKEQAEQMLVLARLSRNAAD